DDVRNRGDVEGGVDCIVDKVQTHPSVVFEIERVADEAGDGVALFNDDAAHLRAQPQIDGEAGSAERIIVRARGFDFGEAVAAEAERVADLAGYGRYAAAPGHGSRGGGDEIQRRRGGLFQAVRGDHV